MSASESVWNLPDALRVQRRQPGIESWTEHLQKAPEGGGASRQFKDTNRESESDPRVIMLLPALPWHLGLQPHRFRCKLIMSSSPGPDTVVRRDVGGMGQQGGGQFV